MQKYCGKGVYGALAVGKAVFVKRRETEICRCEVTDIGEELERLKKGKQKAAKQLSEIYEKALREVGEDNARIFETHMMMLEDEDYNESIRNIIRTQSVNAEYAVFVTGENFAAMFSSMDDSYMKARAADVKDISQRLCECMARGHRKTAVPKEPCIICADDLAPSETVLFDKDNVLAFVTGKGSENSHTAILARNMNIPAVVGVGKEFCEMTKDGDTLAVDGYTGEVFVCPDKKTLEFTEAKQKADMEKKELLKNLKGKDNVTLDGTRIKIYANIGSVDHVGAALFNDAEGIGLFRSEFLYLESSDYPDEERQFSVYKRVLECMGGKKVIIRTLDIGADKRVDYFGLENEENPALGLRAVRLCLEREDVFRTQLRALFKASVYGDLGIMFPMIANEWELDKVLEICGCVKRELCREGIEYSDNTEIGIMIETPAAALISERLAPKVDFFSIGTNDLTQYTLAVDRQNPLLEKFCDVHHEAVLKLIEMTSENAHKHGTWVGICGELAADTSLTEDFLRMGIDELSVSPAYVLKVREAVRNTDLKKLRDKR